jgi:phosphate transport system permease protein
MDDLVQTGRLSRKRYWSNKATQWVVGLGGAAVIGAITTIFAYLLWVVAPILLPASIDSHLDFAVVERQPLLVDVSENGEAILRISAKGILDFYDAESGQPIAAYNLGLNIKRAQQVYPTVDTYALLDEENRLLFVSTQYIVDFDDGTRRLTPKLEFPFSKTPQAMGNIESFDAQWLDDELVIASNAGTTINLRYFNKIETGYPLPKAFEVSVSSVVDVSLLFLGPRNQWLYAVSASGDLDVIGIKPKNKIVRLYQGSLATNDNEVTAVTALLGRYSLMVADNAGFITQWGIFVSKDGTQLEPMRQFEVERPSVRMITEPRRKGFIAVDGEGDLTLLYPTSGRVLADFAAGLSPDAVIAISPRSNVLVSAENPSLIRTFHLENEHPEISLSSLWGKVWYEGYEEPLYSWQSSSADNDFEPKFSLMPLAFGTLKAAFYALIFAVPIAIMGAIYTAYFMAPAMRAWVKPSIEIMAALPTVILGFIGGLWLAPIIEEKLSSVLSIFFVLPAGLFLFALLWSKFPEKITARFAGWYGLIVTPLIVITIYLAFGAGPFFEEQFFGGDSRAWFRDVLGLNYDQRNALVVGIVMGLAVIPTIFSIAEDAVYAVPTHLVRGSLALGATPWQTLVKVVLLTASPGIFSAVMIGMGRAVGETMIVLMATGNTPLMDLNIFEGMRTFAANIAVELPEAEVDSSHYRILFLAALVLFMFTFALNTLAEVVRQRLRARYGSL